MLHLVDHYAECVEFGAHKFNKILVQTVALVSPLRDGSFSIVDKSHKVLQLPSAGALFIEGEGPCPFDQVFRPCVLSCNFEDCKGYIIKGIAAAYGLVIRLYQLKSQGQQRLLGSKRTFR